MTSRSLFKQPVSSSFKRLLVVILTLIYPVKLHASDVEPFYFFRAHSITGQSSLVSFPTLGAANQYFQSHYDSRNADFPACMQTARERKRGICSQYGSVSILPNTTHTRNNYYSLYRAEVNVTKTSANADGSEYIAEAYPLSHSISTLVDCPPGYTHSFKSIPFHTDDICLAPAGPPPNPKQCQLAGNPVNFITGEKVEAETDFEDKNGLTLARRYINQFAGWVIEPTSSIVDFSGRFPAPGQSGSFCIGRTFTFQLTSAGGVEPVNVCLPYAVKPDSPPKVLLQDERGKTAEFSLLSGNQYVSSDFEGFLTAIDPAANGGKAWQLNYLGGKKEFFGSNGLLMSRLDELNRTVNYIYDNGKLVRKESQFGSWIEFNDSGNQLSAVTSAGQTILYAYESLGNGPGQRRLKTVSVGGTKISEYAYGATNLPYAITGVLNGANLEVGSWEYIQDPASPHFGRAVLSRHNDYDQFSFDYSALIGSSGSVKVTNPLGKETIYRLGTVQSRLVIQQVEGVASTNCAAANKSYTYYPNATLKSKTDWSGNITSYVRDNFGRETSRTEAAGTPQARTITTEYHPTLNKPVRIIEPGLTVEMTYNAEGRLLSTKNIATP